MAMAQVTLVSGYSDGLQRVSDLCDAEECVCLGGGDKFGAHGKLQKQCTAVAQGDLAYAVKQYNKEQAHTQA